MTSTVIQPLQREIYEKPTFIRLQDSRLEQKSLVMYHTLPSLHICVWLVNTLTSTAPIGSPIICMWSPADIYKQRERNLSFGSADVSGAGTCDEPLRTSAWEYTSIGRSREAAGGNRNPSLFIAHTEAEDRTYKNLLICLGSGWVDPWSDLNIWIYHCFFRTIIFVIFKIWQRPSLTRSSNKTDVF